MEAVAKITNIEGIVTAKPFFLPIVLNVIKITIKPEYSSNDKQYTPLDFEEINASKIEKAPKLANENYDTLFVYLANPSQFEVSRTISVLQNNKIIDGISTCQGLVTTHVDIN